MSEDTKIITPENPAAPVEQKSTEQEAGEAARLSTQAVNALAGAVAQLVDIESRAIVQPNDEKLKKELRAYIANTMAKHAQEFIGCWFTVRMEYEPMCNTIANVLRHVDAIRQQRYQQAREAEKMLSDAAAKLKEQDKKA